MMRSHFLEVSEFEDSQPELRRKDISATVLHIDDGKCVEIQEVRT